MPPHKDLKLELLMTKKVVTWKIFSIFLQRLVQYLERGIYLLKLQSISYGMTPLGHRRRLSLPAALLLLPLASP